MELRHLRYFIAVAEHKSVRLASERIFISQPAVSRQIQDLEKELGFSLFERLPRGLKLTPAGVFFLEAAQRVLAELDGAAHRAKRIANGLQGHLRLGFVENAGWDGLMPAALRQFQREVPDASIELIARNTPEQLRNIEGGVLDGGFIYAYESLITECEILPLVAHGVVLAVPVSWQMSGQPVELRQMADKPFVIFPRRVYPAYYDCLIGACQKLGVTLRIVQEERTESAILALVCSGVGAAIVNSANRGRPPALARFIEFSDLSVPMPLSFAFDRANTNPLLERFVQTLRQVASEAEQGASPQPGP